MENKNLLIIAALGVAGYMYLNGGAKEKYFLINGQSVPESRLPAMGYTFINGQWWPNSAIQAAAGQGGVTPPNTAPGTNPNGDQTWAIISTILNTGMQFVPLLLNGNNNSGSGMGTGTGTNTGGGSGGGSGSMA